MFDIIERFDPIINQYLGDRNFKVTSRQLRTIESEILADLDARIKEEEVTFFYWKTRDLEDRLRRVYRTYSARPSITGGRIILVLLEVYEKLIGLLRDTAATLCFFNLVLRKLRTQFRGFAWQFNLLLAEGDYPEELYRLAYLPLQVFEDCKATDTFIYGQFLYLLEFKASFELLMNSRARQDFDKLKMLCKLIELNLNHPDLEQYFYQVCKEEIKKGQELKRLKMIKLMLEMPLARNNPPFDSHNKSLNESIHLFIALQMEALESKTDLQVPLLEQPRIKLFLSVPQIGALLFLLLKRGIFGKISHSKLGSHFSNAFSSIDTEKISEASLKNSIKIEPGVYESLLELLQGMIQDLRDHFL